jgi:hypothetical protein
MNMKKKLTMKRKLAMLAVAAIAGLGAGPAGATPVPIFNGDFQAPFFDEDGASGSPAWHWVTGWDEGGASYYGTSSAPGYLYMDGPDGSGAGAGWVSQNLSYNWTAGDFFTLGIKGNQGWRAGGTFKIQLREADGTVLWDSGTTSVNSIWQNFSWNIDASTFSGAGVTPGSQLNIRIECPANSVYLDDVTLSTSLADTTPPTLASSAIVDNKSGGPVNAYETVTYTVTFSELMAGGTVSSSDFDNGGTAAVLIGTPTTTNGLAYTIPVVASGTGTLRLRVPVGATMTDSNGVPLDTSAAILDDTTINVVAKPIAVTGGDFQVPYTNDQPVDVPLWYDSTSLYADWHNAARYSANGSQTALINRNNLGVNGYIYQPLGQLEAGTARLDWSFDQVKGPGTAVLRFFYGASTVVVADGVDIDTLGFTQIGSTVSFPGESVNNVVSRTGSVDVSAVPAGATIWMDFTSTATVNDFFFSLDNISVVGASLQTPYEAWAGGNDFNTLNGEGIAYGMAWLLGAPSNSSPSIGLLPKSRHEAGKLVVEFTCLKVAKRGTAVLKLQSSKDLGLTDLWTDHEVVVPDTAGPVGPVTFSVPTTNANPDLVDLKAEIPSSEASLFGRLKASETP